MLEKQLKLYQEEISTLSGSIKEARDLRIKIKQEYELKDSSLSGSINQDKARIEKLNLCIQGKSMDCVKADKKSLSLLAPNSAYAEASSEPIGVPPSTTIIAFRNDFYCEKRAKTTGIEYHFTAENYESQPTNEAKLLSLWRAHTSKTGRVQWDGIGYHFVITQDGTIFNTRNQDCRAIADAWYEKSLLSNENTEHVHISFIGDDKPTANQTRSMVWLGQKLLNTYNLDRWSITSHSENAAKSLKESIKWWYGSKENFIKNFSDGPDKQTIVLRNGVQNAAATYAWNTYKDMDFMLTIDQESAWDTTKSGDGWDAYGLCQLNRQWHQDKIDKYKSFSVRGQVDYCRQLYVQWQKDWVLAKQLHGWENRMSRSKFLTFQ